MAQQKGKLQIAAQELQKIVDGGGMSKTCSVFDDGGVRQWTEQEKAFAAQLKRSFQGYFNSWVKDHLQSLINAHPTRERKFESKTLKP